MVSGRTTKIPALLQIQIQLEVEAGEHQGGAGATWASISLSVEKLWLSGFSTCSFGALNIAQNAFRERFLLVFGASDAGSDEY